MSFESSVSQPTTSDSLENITSANNLRNDLRNISKNRQTLDERKNLVDPPCNTTSFQENYNGNTLSNKTAESPSKHSMHITCSNCKLISLMGDDLTKHSPVDHDKHNSVDTCYSAITIKPRRSDLKAKLSSKNSLDNYQNECSIDLSNNKPNTLTSKESDFKQQKTNSQNDEQNQYSMYQSTRCFDTEISRGDNLRHASRNSQITDIVDGNNLYSLDVLYTNPNSVGGDLRQKTNNKTAAGQNTYFVAMDIYSRSPSKARSGRNDLSEAGGQSEVVLADNNQNNDYSFSTVSSHGNGLQQTSTKNHEVGHSHNKCSINIPDLKAKKSPDLRLPKRINCWDIKPSLARSTSEKLSCDGNVKTMMARQGHANQVTRNVKVQKSITNHIHSLQKPSLPYETKPRNQIFEKSKTQIPTTMALSWDTLAAQKYNMQSEYSSAEHSQQNILNSDIIRGTENTDKLTATNSISLKLSAHPIITTRKRKRAIDENSLLIGSKWKSMVNSESLHLHSQVEVNVNVAVPDERKPQQRCWSTGQLENYNRTLRELKANQVSKNIDNGEKETNGQEQQILHLKPTDSNDKGISSQSDLESAANRIKRHRIRNKETKVFSKSCPMHKTVVTIGAQASQKVDYTESTEVVKHCNEEQQNTHDSTNSFVQEVQENTKSSNNIRRKIQQDYPRVRELNPFSISSTKEKVQDNYNVVCGKIPSHVSIIHRQRQEDYSPIWKEKPNSNDSIHRDLQVDYPQVQKQNPNGTSSIHRERQDDYPAVWEEKPHSNNSINRGVHVDHPQVQTQNQNPNCNTSTIHREGLEDYPPEWEHKPSCVNSLHRERQIYYPVGWEQKPNCFSWPGNNEHVQVAYSQVHKAKPNLNINTHKEVTLNYPIATEQKPNSKISSHTEVQVDNFTESKTNANFQRKIEVNHAMPRLTTMQESEKYLNSCNYSDYKERISFSTKLESNNQQQCKHCKSVRDDLSREHLIQHNSNQRVDQNLQKYFTEQSHEAKQKHGVPNTVQSENVCAQGDKNKYMQQWVTKASRDFPNRSSEHLVRTVYYNFLPNKDCPTEFHKPQTTWNTTEELSEHNIKDLDKQYMKSQHKSMPESKPICVCEEEHDRDFQTRLYEQQPQTQWKIQKQASEHDSNNDAKFLTLKSVAEMDQMHAEEIPNRDVHEALGTKCKITEEFSKHGTIDTGYNVLQLKSISKRNRMNVVEKCSRDISSKVNELPETKHVFQFKSKPETTQTHAEHSNQCFLTQQNEMLKQKSNSSNKYLDGTSKVLRQDQSQTKHTPEYTGTSRDSIMEKNEFNTLQEPKIVQTNKLRTQAETASSQGKRKHKTRIKREGDRESKEKASVKPVQQYRIKWMTRKENELYEQAMGGHLDEAELIMPGKEQRRHQSTSKERTVLSHTLECNMNTILETNGCQQHLQVEKSTSETSWHNCTTPVKENIQEPLWCQNHAETRGGKENIQNIWQYQERIEDKSDSSNHICMPTTISHADRDSNDGCKQVRNPSQETTKPNMKDASTYCNFKRTRKIVQQLKAEYGNFEALTNRMKHITRKVLTQVDNKTADTKGLDRKIKDLYEYCQKRHTSSLKDVEHDRERKTRSKFSTNVTTNVEHDELRKFHHKLGEIDYVSVLSEDMEIDTLLQIGVLGRGCCGLPPALIHMHGVISNITDNPDLNVIKLQYGDTQYTIEGTTVHNFETQEENRAPQLDSFPAVTIASENLWQKIKELYDYSKTLYTAKSSTSNTSVHPEDAVLVEQSTESVDISGLCKDTSDDSLEQVECNDIPAKDENVVLDLGCNDTSTWNDNTFLECNVVSVENANLVGLLQRNDTSENEVLECNGMSGMSNMVVECNSISVGNENSNRELEGIDIPGRSDSKKQELYNVSTQSENVGKHYNHISTENECTFVDGNGRTSISENIEHECSNTSVRNENILEESNDIYVKNGSSTLESNDWARDVFVFNADGNHTQFNSLECENTSTCEEKEMPEPSVDENSIFLPDTDKSTTANQPHNLTESGTNNTVHPHNQQQLFSYPNADSTNFKQSQLNEENTSTYETKNLFVNAELINNSTLNLILKFPSTLKTDTGLNADVEVDVDGNQQGELIHTSTERLPISVALEHTDLGKENAPMVTTVINVKSSPINQNDKSELVKLDSESVNICLAMECKPHSEQDEQHGVLSNRSISKQFFLLKQRQPQRKDSQRKCCYKSDEVLKNVAKRSESCGPHNQKVLDPEPEEGDPDKPMGAYTLNVFVVRQPGIELHVRSSSETSLA